MPSHIPDSARPSVAGEEFASILFDHAEDGAGIDSLTEPDFFHDLNLDQLVQSITAGWEQYDLKPFSYAPLHRVDAVHYRHEVQRDLEDPRVLESINRFTEQLRTMRKQLDSMAEVHYPLEKQAWFVDAVETYCAAVQALADDLAHLTLNSRGLQGFRTYLTGYHDSAAFTALATETARLKQAAAEVRYALRINGPRVTVTRYHDQPDYGAEVEQTFAKFQQRAVADHLTKLSDTAGMNHVEAQILDGIAKLYPDLYRSRAEFCARNRDYLDPLVGRFDREVHFYLAYLDLVNRLRAAGLPFCYPHVSARSKDIGAEDTFDLALAAKLVGQGDPVVCNDFHLQGAERVFVVSGPNNGGKTTFARTFGQLPCLAALGLPVPGREARLFLPDRIFTHFEKEEDIATLRGKFDDELVRVHEILEQATSSSIVVMNESFNSTSLSDALFVGTEVMRRILELGCLGVYVTFVDEIAALDEATVSMVSQVVPDDPAQRTFKLIRKAADGRAYAWAIADKYGLSYQRLTERITS